MLGKTRWSRDSCKCYPADVVMNLHDMQPEIYQSTHTHFLFTHKLHFNWSAQGINCVYICHMCVQMTKEAREGCQIPWSSSFRQLWAIQCGWLKQQALNDKPISVDQLVCFKTSIFFWFNMLTMLFISKMPQIFRRTVSIGIATVLNHPLALEDDTINKRFCANSHISLQCILVSPPKTGSSSWMWSKNFLL